MYTLSCGHILNKLKHDNSSAILFWKTWKCCLDGYFCH